MRITGGSCRGRPLKTPDGNDIRPTSDKVRQAVFNALFSRAAVMDAVVIDAFCGTGALGLEALSQGAEQCLFCDAAKPSLNLAKENAVNLGLDDRSTFRLTDAGKLGKKPDGTEKATLVFLDPPYRKDMVTPTLTALKDGGWIEDGALCVIETARDENWQPAIGEMIFDKNYGDTRIVFLKI